MGFVASGERTHVTHMHTNVNCCFPVLLFNPECLNDQTLLQVSGGAGGSPHNCSLLSFSGERVKILPPPSLYFAWGVFEKLDPVTTARLIT